MITPSQTTPAQQMPSGGLQQPGQDLAGQQPQPPGSPTGPSQPGTTDKQQIFKMFIENCLRVVYEKNFWATLIKMSASADPVKGMGDTLGMMAGKIAISAVQSGINLDESIFVPGLAKVLGVIATDMQQNGGIDLNQDQMKGILFRATNEMRTELQQKGLLNQGMYQQKFNQLKQMNSSGQLAPMLGMQQNRKQRRAQYAKGKTQSRRIGSTK